MDSKSACEGYGECINNSNYTCSHNCTKCPNYDICGNICPELVLGCHGGTCMNCAINGWKFEKIEEKECPICMETITCYQLSNCTHYVCKICLYNMLCKPYEYPDFPYPEDHPLSKLYDEDPNDVRILSDKKIQLYESTIDDIIYTKKDEYLSICPICRKII